MTWPLSDEYWRLSSNLVGWTDGSGGFRRARPPVSVIVFVAGRFDGDGVHCHHTAAGEAMLRGLSHTPANL